MKLSTYLKIRRLFIDIDQMFQYVSNIDWTIIPIAMVLIVILEIIF